jgi:phosphoglycerate dehydrogenase-like enzyme
MPQSRKEGLFLKKRLVLVAACCVSLAVAESRKIAVLDMPPEQIAELRSASPDTKIVLVDKDSVLREAADADAIMGGMTPEILHAAHKLKWVQSYSAGVENFLFPEFQATDVVLTNCKILMGPEIADHAFALLLSLTRGLNRAIPGRAGGVLHQDDYHPIELRGKTAVVVGVGGIGSQIAQRAQAFGMTVIGVDPKDMPLNPYVSRMVYPEEIDSVLPLADVLFISAPLTAKSQGMIGPRQFELLKKSAYFVAVSRGKVYNTDALVKALDSRQLAGAGLDVTNPEPLPKEHALWKFDNVVITPHIAGQSDNVSARQMALFKENIARFVHGQPLMNVVDKQKGY